MWNGGGDKNEEECVSFILIRYFLAILYIATVILMADPATLGRCLALLYEILRLASMELCVMFYRYETYSRNQ